MVAGMRTAVVTGAGSGLGRAIAVELLGRGYRVHVTDVDAGAADRVAAELGGEAKGSAMRSPAAPSPNRSPAPARSTSGSTTLASSSAGRRGGRAPNCGRRCSTSTPPV
jgi:NAD(P)-dependent dehydrogenase (short-subunit alcohol dehydrogenase family)